MTEYRTEDGRQFFASNKVAAMHYLREVNKTLRFLEEVAEAWAEHEEQLSPETNDVLDNFVEQVVGNDLMPDMRACLRAWEAYQSE